MGQISRINRSGRFIAEFEKDYVVRSAFRPGQKLVVKEVMLSNRECAGEEVCEYLVLEDDKGELHQVEVPGICFDPESCWQDDIVDQLVNDLGLTYQEARERMARAELFVGGT
jgi:hypothetical protein